ncbi:MAG: hypothetical protein K2W99_06765 [Chthoniobacterales bacterium]|nr:hypothetical protein [Chthoniobacterales bacterium]
MDYLFSSRLASEQEKKGLQSLQAAMPEEGLFAEKVWRQSPEPFLMAPNVQKSLEQLGHRLNQFNVACDLLYRLSYEGRQPVWIAELLDRGKPPELIALARVKAFRGSVANVIRPDLLLTKEGFTICELDTIPGGIGLTAWLQEVYSELGFEMLGGAQGMLRGFYSILSGGDIVVSEESATYRPEMLYLIKRLHELFPQEQWRLCSSENQEKWASQVYRFFELFDVANVPCAADLFERALTGELTLTPPPKPQLEEKLWFALFWMKPLREFWIRQLTQRGFEQLQKVIPYTWLLNPEPLPVQAVYPRLETQSWEEVANFSQQERELVIKISGFDERAWGSRGVVIGADVSKEAWGAALRKALSEFAERPHLLQVFHHSSLQDHSYFSSEEEITTMKGRVRLTPYYFITSEKVTLSGALATICPADKKMLHGMKDAILVPVAVIAKQ